MIDLYPLIKMFNESLAISTEQVNTWLSIRSTCNKQFSVSDRSHTFFQLEQPWKWSFLYRWSHISTRLPFADAQTDNISLLINRSLRNCFVLCRNGSTLCRPRISNSPLILVKPGQQREVGRRNMFEEAHLCLPQTSKCITLCTTLPFLTRPCWSRNKRIPFC